MDIVRQEGYYRIERNANGGSYFLVYQEHAGQLPHAVGGAYVEPNHESDGWTVDVNEPYDSMTNTDVRVLGQWLEEQAAVDLLWAMRHSAYLG